jgi:hypothetical protein
MDRQGEESAGISNKGTRCATCVAQWTLQPYRSCGLPADPSLVAGIIAFTASGQTRLGGLGLAEVQELRKSRSFDDG